MIHRSIRSNDRGAHAETQAAVFSLLHYQWQAFTFAPALRFDWHKRRGWEWVPQVSAAWQKAGFQLRGSAGKSIRDADFTERYNNYNKPLVITGRIGNEALEAEKAFAWEAGVGYTVKGFSVSGGYFQRFHKDLVDYVNTPFSKMPRKTNLVDTGKYALAMNIGAVHVNGAELDLQYNVTFKNKYNLSAMAGLLRTSTHSDNAATALYLSSAAKFLANFNLQVSAPKWSVGFTGLYKERNAQSAPAIQATLTPAYFVLHGKAEYRLLKNKAGIYIQSDNIFDRQYSDILGARMPGRWFLGGARFNF
jgi:vitamin B12 transporter